MSEINPKLCDRIKGAIRKKLFFAHDIANVLRENKLTVISHLCDMVRRGELVKDDSGEPTAWYIADPDAAPGDSEAAPAKANARSNASATATAQATANG